MKRQPAIGLSPRRSSRARRMCLAVLLCAGGAWLPVANGAQAEKQATFAWQAAGVPYGGIPEAIVVRGDRVFVNARGYGAPIWWVSADRGASWRLASGRLRDAWAITIAGDLLVAEDADGFHRSRDWGRSWSACAAAHLPSGTERMMVAGDSLFWWVPKRGLFRSQDQCGHWTQVAIPWNVADDPTVGFMVARDAGLIVADTGRAWFRTEDYGETWHRITPPDPHAQLLPAAHDGRPSIVSRARIVVGTTKGVFRSTDGGASWSFVGFPDRWVESVVTTEDGDIYVAVPPAKGAPVPRSSVMRSSDFGQTWVKADEGLSGLPLEDVTRDQAAGPLYAAGKSGVYRLESPGRWRHVGLPMFFPTFLLAAPSGDLYLGADYGEAYRSSDRGATWRALLLLEPDSPALCMSALKSGDLLAGTSTGLLRSGDRGDTWTNSSIAERAVKSVSEVPRTGSLFAASSGIVLVSRDNGATWMESKVAGEDDEVRTLAVGQSGVVIAGTDEGYVYRSEDGGKTWRAAPDMRDGSPVSALAVLANGDVLAGLDFGLYRWKPGTTTWETLPLPAGRIRGVVADGGDRLVVGSASAGVFVSEDSGRTWATANGGLPTTHVRALTLAADGTFYVATGSAGIEYGQGLSVDYVLRIFKARLRPH